jgi:hypothetical protein
LRRSRPGPGRPAVTPHKPRRQWRRIGRASSRNTHTHAHSLTLSPPSPLSLSNPHNKQLKQGCGCDPGILSLISAANADADTLSGAVRLAQTSHCAAAGPSGWVDPCPGASSCLTPVKTAAVAAPKVAG